MKLCDIKRNNPYIFNSWRQKKVRELEPQKSGKIFLPFFF